VPDEQAVIEAELKRQADEVGCALIVTTGVLVRHPAMSRRKRQKPYMTNCCLASATDAASPKYVPTAILSRQPAARAGGR
jgi:molybdopterin adenylyltransferase